MEGRRPPNPTHGPAGARRIGRHDPTAAPAAVVEAANNVGELIRRWALRAATLGVLVSLLVHVLVLATAGAWRIGRPADAPEQRVGTQVQFAVMSELELAEVTDTSALDAEGPRSVESVELDLQPLTDALDGAEVEELLERPADLAASPVTSPSGNVPVSGATGAAGSSGAGGGASFFGLEARGRRFCYIVDVSTSMNQASWIDDLTGARGPQRYVVTKAELNRSVAGLIESAEFSIVLYAGTAEALLGSARWVDATDANKALARQRIGLIDPGEQGRLGIREDGTEPATGFRLAFKLRPPPDAIYFMTDGAFAEEHVEQIRQLNASLAIPIHCILFAEAGSSLTEQVEPMMRRIARESGGSYRQVEGRP